MECYKIKNFLINGIKGLLFIYIQMIIIISILYMFDMNIYLNTNELMGVNLLSINIEKNKKRCYCQRIRFRRTTCLNHMQAK